MIEELCPPALIYLAFSLIHITIDLFKGLYNTAFIKFIVMIFFTLLLNILCSTGLTIISWLLVFIPFIMLTVITSILLYIFGLSPNIGSDLKIKKTTKEKFDNREQEEIDIIQKNSIEALKIGETIDITDKAILRIDPPIYINAMNVLKKAAFDSNYIKGRTNYLKGQISQIKRIKSYYDKRKDDE